MTKDINGQNIEFYIINNSTNINYSNIVNTLSNNSNIHKNSIIYVNTNDYYTQYIKDNEGKILPLYYPNNAESYTGQIQNIIDNKVNQWAETDSLSNGKKYIKQLVDEYVTAYLNDVLPSQSILQLQEQLNDIQNQINELKNNNQINSIESLQAQLNGIQSIINDLHN